MLGDKKPPYDARAIANFILDYAEKNRTPITIMKLLKLIYLAHADHLNKTQRPLIKNTIRAWKHGPVIQSVYDNFKHHKEKPITSRASQLNVLDGTQSLAKYELNKESSKLILDVFHQYSQLTAFELSNITHLEGWAWDRVWNTEEITPGMVISDTEILKYSPSMSEKKLH